MTVRDYTQSPVCQSPLLALLELTIGGRVGDGATRDEELPLLAVDRDRVISEMESGLRVSLLPPLPNDMTR